MDLFQIIISLAIFISVSFFVTLSIQLFFIFKETRKILMKVDSVATDAEKLSHEIEEASEKIGESIGNISTYLNIFNLIRSKIIKNKKGE